MASSRAMQLDISVRSMGSTRNSHQTTSVVSSQTSYARSPTDACGRGRRGSASSEGSSHERSWMISMSPSDYRFGCMPSQTTNSSADRCMMWTASLRSASWERSGFSAERFIGQWVDPSGGFFGGAVIEIYPDGWRPLDPKTQAHKVATYERISLSASKLLLTEQSPKGLRNCFHVVPGGQDTLLVMFAETNLHWRMVRHMPMKGFILCFKDSKEEAKFAVQVNHDSQKLLYQTSAFFSAVLVMKFASSYVYFSQNDEDLLLHVPLLCLLGTLLFLLALCGFSHLDLIHTDSCVVIGACLLSTAQLFTIRYRVLSLFAPTLWADELRDCGAEDCTEEGGLLMTYALVTLAVHLIFKVRTSRSWSVPTVQVVVYLAACAVAGTGPQVYWSTLSCAILLALLGYICWRFRYRSEREERRAWAVQNKLALVLDEQDRQSTMAHNRVQIVEERMSSLRAILEESRTHENLAADERPHCLTPRIHVVPPTPPVTPATTTRGESVSSQTFHDDSQVRQPAPQFVDVEAVNFFYGGSPNALLVAAVRDQQANMALIQSMAARIRDPAYGLDEFADDCVKAFPELGLFFLQNLRGTGCERTAALEYQRTVGALFAVYWLLRLDSDGKQGFCFGALQQQDDSGALVMEEDPDEGEVPFSKLSDEQKRQAFLTTMEWEKFAEVISLSGCDDVDRIAAMLCLTAFHDIMKVSSLCPEVSAEHAPWQGYEAGAVINDHDLALCYVLQYHPQLLPSYSALPEGARKAVLFSQGKMQFNHGWFVQGEAPPGAMLSHLKSCLHDAECSDLAFYFFHWLTDLAGAEATPRRGAEKFVLKFPHAVLKEFLWSIPYLGRLKDNVETAVAESYLEARWLSTFPSVKGAPLGLSAVAQMRLAIMAQGGASLAVDAFNALPDFHRDVLSVELARSGVDGQAYTSSPVIAGPALLLYYGPAVLQRCQDNPEGMFLALQLLVAVMRAARAIWPVDTGRQGDTVVIEVGNLKALSVEEIFSEQPNQSVWALVQRNSREAVAELVSAQDLNELHTKGQRCWVLELSAVEPIGFESFITEGIGSEEDIKHSHSESDASKLQPLHRVKSAL